MPASYLNQCLADMRAIAQTGRWTLEAQVHAYDLLDIIASIEPASHEAQFSVAIPFTPEAILSFCKEYDSLEQTLSDAYDNEALLAIHTERVKSQKENMDKAEKKAQTMTELHECAKETFNIWQKDGIFARRRALRILREKAGFRLEYKRIGNYVAKTFDLMNEARTAYARAQQAFFASDVTYKIRPGIYAEIRKKLGSLLPEDNPLA